MHVMKHLLVALFCRTLSSTRKIVTAEIYLFPRQLQRENIRFQLKTFWHVLEGKYLQRELGFNQDLQARASPVTFLEAEVLLEVKKNL